MKMVLNITLTTFMVTVEGIHHLLMMVED